MIRPLFYLLLSIGIWVAAHPVQAQNEVSLDYFEASQNQDEILLKWAISKGSFCNGITITRSSDSLFFETIGRIEGVCGSPDFQQPYSFVDEDPLPNQKNYYKLELGTTAFSEVIFVEMIQRNEEGFQIIPHPLKTQGRIYFDNPDYKAHKLYVYHLNGQLVYEASTTDSFFELDGKYWTAGLYLFQIIHEEKYIQGKILISP